MLTQLTTSLRTLLLQISHGLSDAAKYQFKPEDGHPTLTVCCLAVLSSRTMAEQHSDSPSSTQRTSDLPQSDCQTGLRTKTFSQLCPSPYRDNRPWLSTVTSLRPRVSHFVPSDTSASSSSKLPRAYLRHRILVLRPWSSHNGFTFPAITSSVLCRRGPMYDGHNVSIQSGC